MESWATEAEHRRYAELQAAAPMRPRSLAVRDGDRFLLAGTLGVEFDAWQRHLAAVSGADNFFAQRIGLAAVERVMDELEASLRSQLHPGERLEPRRSPGYPGIPLAVNAEILAKLDAGRRLGITMTDSGLLMPLKTVTAICKIGRTGNSLP